jgi:putative ABC transport system ATP-binding protein
MTERLSLTDVVRQYRTPAETVRAVDGVSLTLHSGTVTAIVGPSGAGKTTLINLIVGWDRPTSGAVRRMAGDDWQGIAVVPQGLGLLPELTIAENVWLPVRLGNPARRPLEELLEAVGIVDLARRLPDEVSMGEQQRAAVARALAAGPRILVADEPTAHQDEANVRRISELLTATAAEGAAVLVATHDRRLLDTVDAVIRLEDGLIV